MEKKLVSPSEGLREEEGTFPATGAALAVDAPDAAPPLDADRSSFTSMSPINQQTLADQLNISRATVSRCFTNHPGINPRTRAKVFHLAARLGYKHMEMRTSAIDARERRVRVGVLICTDVEEFTRLPHDTPGQRLLEGTSEFGLLQAFTTEVCYIDPNAQTLDHPSYTSIEALHKRVWDGLLLIYSFPKVAIDHLMLHYPVVSLAERYRPDGTQHRGRGPLRRHRGAHRSSRRPGPPAHRFLFAAVSRRGGLVLPAVQRLRGKAHPDGLEIP